MKKLLTAIIEQLNYFMGIKNITQYALAEQSGVPYPTIKSIMQRRTKGISLKTVIMLCDGLGISLHEFLDEEKFSVANLDLE